MSSTMQTSEILNRAADLIEERGWAGGAAGAAGWHPTPESVTPVCAEGALRLANNGWRPNHALASLSEYLREPYPECFNPFAGKVVVFAWNDAQGRTAAEVIEVLRACSVIEASRERQAVTA